MSVNEDFVTSGSDSFWEVGKYMRSVKRCDNGYQLCVQLRRLIEERSEIEKKYSALLQDWTKKWNSYLDKGPEYGTTLGAWRGVLTEADHVADLHTVMAERLMADVYGSIKVWQKENYHKSMMHYKETKEFEDGYRKAQKPWGKRLSKVMTAKKEYHSACRSEKSTANQENNARGDTTVSQDQLKKLQDKLRKCQTEVEGSRDKYTAAVNDLNSYNPKYIEDMGEIYNKCQDFEHKRLDFFKKTFFSLHACLDLSVESSYSQIYTSLHTTIGNLDPSKDLKWWSSTYGVDMAMAWPEFEEYSPELQSISKRNKAALSSSDGGITITSIKHSREDSYGSYTEQQQHQPPQPQQSYNSQMSDNSYASVGKLGSDSYQRGSWFQPEDTLPRYEYDNYSLPPAISLEDLEAEEVSSRASSSRRPSVELRPTIFQPAKFPMAKVRSVEFLSGRRPSIELPSAKPPAKLPVSKQRSVELPSPRRPAELPSPRRPAELPSVRRPAELPSPKRPSELPSIRGSVEISSIKVTSVEENSEISLPTELPSTKSSPVGSPRPDSGGYDQTLNPFGEDEEETSQPEETEKPQTNPTDSPVNNGENPFGDPDPDEAEPDSEDPPSDGWTVRALYDYVKAEDDELEFKSGDIFIQIATEDEMGWCKGKKGGQVGFYPKNYVERI